MINVNPNQVEVTRWRNVCLPASKRFAETEVRVAGLDMVLYEVYGGWSIARDPTNERDSALIEGLGHNALKERARIYFSKHPEEAKELRCEYLLR